MAKIYYNDNGTWKVVDISGGGGGGSSTGGKIYRHNVHMTSSANESTLIFLSSSNVQITFDSLAQNANGEWARFIFGTVSKTSGDYAVEKVHGLKDQYTTEVYLDPVVPSADGSDSVIMVDPTSFTDQVTEL